MDWRILLVAFVVAASGCASSTADNPQEPMDTSVPETDGNESVHTVEYTDSGFQPAQLTIEQGDTVVWTDSSSRGMWVASDRHPIHSEYSGTSLNQHCGNGEEAFDQCDTSPRYEFTFDKTGEWGYHNHQYSTHTGTIVVE